MQVVYDTNRERASQRFDHVRGAMQRLRAPLEVVGAPSVDVRMSQWVTGFNEVEVAVLESGSDRPLTLQRTPQLISKTDPQAYRLVVHHSGHTRLEQAGNQLRLANRGLTLLDTSQPYVVCREAGMKQARKIMLTIPKRLLTAPEHDVRNLLCRDLTTTRKTAGRALTEILTGMADKIGPFEQLNHGEVSQLLCDMLDCLLGSPTIAVDHTRARARMARIHAGAREMAANPHLTLHDLAQALNTSTRLIYALTQSRGTTPMALVKRYRLEGIHRDLTRASTSRERIRDIAKRWGYNNHPQMTRDFKQLYGYPPVHLRRHRRRGTAQHGSRGQQSMNQPPPPAPGEGTRHG